VTGKILLVVALAGLALAIAFAWQIGTCQLNSIEFHDDLRDIAAQLGPSTALYQLKSDEEIRAEVIRAAAEHDIHLKPEQVTLARSGKPEAPQFEISADYNVHVNLFVYSFNIHYIQTSAK
jgi:hypothetical protein